MKNIHVKISDEMHLQVRKYQIEKELAGEKLTMMEVFVQLIQMGLEKEKESK